MSDYRIKIAGTTKSSFDIGLNKIRLDTSNVSVPYTWKFPASSGVNGYALITDGTGNLSWSAIGASQDSNAPYFVPAGTTYDVKPYKQVLFNLTIDVEGYLDVEGLLVEV